MTSDSAVKTEKFLPFEGLRGCLALLVCVGHLGLNTMVQPLGVQVHFGLAVDIFFALSGFVLCHSNYLGRRRFADFVVGRFARLYPLHIVTVGVMVALAMLAGGVGAVPELVGQATLVNGLGSLPLQPTANYPNWSISVEWWASLAFFCVMMSRRFRPFLLTLVVVGLALAFPGFINTHDQAASGWLGAALVRGVAGFSVGCLAYLASERLRGRVRRPGLVGYAAVCVSVPFFLVQTLDGFQTFAFYLATFTALTGLALSGGGLLAFGPFVELGRISYSIYLWHIPVITAATLVVGEGAISGVGKAPILLVILAVAVASYRLFEHPMQKGILRVWRSRRANTPPTMRHTA